MRAQGAGYGGGAGENIWVVYPQHGSGGTYKSRFRWKGDWQLGKAAVISWMNSPGHRANILKYDYRHIGIGVAKNKRGVIYLTQNFGMGEFQTALHPVRAWNLFWVAVFALVGIVAMGQFLLDETFLLVDNLSLLAGVSSPLEGEWKQAAAASTWVLMGVLTLAVVWPLYRWWRRQVGLSPRRRTNWRTRAVWGLIWVGMTAGLLVGLNRAL